MLLKDVRETLAEHGLVVNEKKSKEWVETVDWLGFPIYPNGDVELGLSVDTIKNWTRPKTWKRLQQWNGLANQYRPFVPNLAQLSAPLYALASKESWTSQWSQEAIDAFEASKAAILNYYKSDSALACFVPEETMRWDGRIQLFWIAGKDNPADIPSRHPVFGTKGVDGFEADEKSVTENTSLPPVNADQKEGKERVVSKVSSESAELNN